MEKISFASDGTMVMDKKKVTMLNKAGYEDKIDLCYLVPYKYYNYETLTEDLSKTGDGDFICVQGKIENLKLEQSGYTSTVKCKLVLTKPNKGLTVYINYFGSKQMVHILKPLVDKECECLVCGFVKYMYDRYFISNPLIFDELAKVKSRMDMTYRKFKGISEEYLNRLIKEALSDDIKETIPEDIRLAFKIPTRKESIKALHNPADKADIMKSVRYHMIEDMLYFACSLELERKDNITSTDLCIDGTEEIIERLRELLPYNLTKDQDNCIDNITAKMQKKMRTTSLVQGDVGCGKSIVAFLLMLAFAEHGYQSVLMAPTFVLASQHYEELKGYADKLGIKTAFLHGGLKTKELKEVTDQIKSGEVKLIVGTHKTAAKDISYNQLGLVIVDEEQRFGVKIRKAIQDKGHQKAHYISFSATPIPRSMAETIYGNMDCYEIKTLPSGRKPVNTVLTADDTVVFNYVKEELERNGQVYVVCPLIEGDDSTTKSTVKEIAKKYEDALKVPIGIVTGKQDSKDTKKTLTDFTNGDIKIIVATTVIEVGVNNPNANTIIIEDANMFGLSQLHQLRGRVGRGNKQGHCILHSSVDAERLDVLCQTNDGFIIAEKDLELRGAGNIFGLEQSGHNRYITTAIQYPKLYRSVQNAAKKMIREHTENVLISEMEKRSEKAYIRINKIKYYES